jgi:hypothetical protein
VGGTRLDVLVTCSPHSEQLTLFPQVRGFYLAKHLARSGLRAEFRQLPVPSVTCEVLICSEYQQSMEWFHEHVAGPFAEIRAERLFCMADHSLGSRPGHFSGPYCEWFGARGGVLCHLTDGDLLPYERWIGLGVDPEVVRPAIDQRRDRVLFDFPKSSQHDSAAGFDLAKLDAVRERLPDLRLVGSGPPGAPIRDEFDDWIDYGQDHATYVRAAFAGVAAVVPGTGESLGLALAEAQVAGACVVASEYQVKRAMSVPEATVAYDADDPRSLAEAMVTGTSRNGLRIRREALERFGFGAVVTRTRAAIGL